MINIGVGISEEMHKKLTTDGKHLTTDAKSSHGLWTNELIIASPACPMIICITRKLEICQIKFICQNFCIGNIINILPLVEGVTVDYHKKKNHPRVIFFMSVVIYRNSLNQRQYVLYYTECLSEGGIAGYGISLQYHPLLWWAGLRKVREKYHIYIYQ